MERTFSLEARAVVPTTLGLTSATPSAGRNRITPTSSQSGTTVRTGASHGAAIDPTRKYEQVRMKYASDSARRKPKRSAIAPPKIAITQTPAPKKPPRADA